MIDTAHGLPDIVTSTDQWSDRCPDCDHDAEVGEPRIRNALRGMLGKLPVRPRCDVRTEDYSGIGTLPCGCYHRTHWYQTS